jgi:hypothetical protein
MLAAPIIRIGAENGERFGTEETIELGDGTDRKRRRHGW